MGNDDIISEIKDNTDYLVKSWSDYLQPAAGETGLIFEHVYNQVLSKDYSKRFETIKGRHGFEQMIVIEGKGITIYKRIFHTSSVENIQGADFVFTKIKHDEIFELAVQVKRNHNRSSFVFNDRDQDQLDRFSNYYPSGYYLFVDETGTSPSYCFVMISELKKILKERPYENSIPNNLIKKYCRGSVVFYKAFYQCRRGSKPKDDFIFEDKVKEYVKESNHTVVELTDSKLMKQKL